MDNQHISLKTPAKAWSQASLLGNGALGAAVYGNLINERIDLSEITFFSGEKSDHNQPQAHLAFQKMREALKKGDYDKVNKDSKEFIGVRKNYGTNLPVGQLLVDLKNINIENTLDYERILNIETGVVSIRGNIIHNNESGSGIKKKVAIKKEAFASHEGNAFFYLLDVDEAQDFNVRFNNTSIPFHITTDDGAYYFHIQAIEKLHCDEAVGVKLLGYIKIIQCDGTVDYSPSGIQISKANNLVIMLKMVTDFDLDEPDFINKSDLKRDLHNDISSRKAYSYIETKKQHEKDISRFMNRVTFSLEGDDDVTEKMFQFGRYLLLSSSRSDSKLPTHLQGIWNDNVACRIGWTCDMHLDINTQMNYWISEAGNLSESHKPLFNWMLKALIPSGRISARKSYGLKGWSADLVSNAWGFSAPYWSNTISPCPTSGIWMASDFWEHFMYQQDFDFLEKSVYLVLHEAVEFFVEYVFKQDDIYMSGPSISPENSFLIENVRHYISMSPTYEIVMIRELFSQYIKMMELLKRKNILLETCLEIINNLPEYQILEDETISEYNHNFQVFDQWHRHTSHLLGLFPYAQITTETTPRLAQAAYNTISEKLKPYHKWEDTGWARSMLMLYMARLKKGDEALWHIQEMQQKLTSENLLVMHPPTRGAQSFQEVYELDGNTGLSMCIIEMLMQSHNNVIHLLPALPKQWPKGMLKGVKARGNIEVDLEWEAGRLTKVSLLSPINKDANICYVDQVKSIGLIANIKTTIEINLGGLS